MYIDFWGQVRTGTGFLVARLVMEEHLGRELTKDEVVHHIDKNPVNNKVENLQVMTRGKHVSFHRTGKVVSEEIRRKISKTLTGHPGANLGKTFTEEHRRKISESYRETLRMKRQLD